MTVDGMSFTGGPDAMLRILEEYGAENRAALDAAVLEGGVVLRELMVAELSAQQHGAGTPTPAARGGAPAEISGELLGSVGMVAGFTPAGAWVRVGATSYKAKFLDAGWRPKAGRSGRRGNTARRALQASDPRGAGKVRYPFVDAVGIKFEALLGPILSRHFHIG